MPADSRTLDDEGVVIPPTRLDDEVLDRPRVAACAIRTSAAATSAHSSRRTTSPSDGWTSSAQRRGRDRVDAAMDELFAYSERVVRAALARLPDGRFEARTCSRRGEGELTIQATVTVAGDEIAFDFAGTGSAARRQPQLPALGHALGLLLRRPLPDRARPALLGRRLRARRRSPRREGSLVNALPPAAVAAGNVETSCRIVDVLFAALGAAVPVPAQGQGTMNNLTLGNDRFTYYETIGGGQGACPERGRALGSARDDVKHADYAGRGPRARVPAPRRAALAAHSARAAPGASAAATASSASCACSRPAASP